MHKRKHKKALFIFYCFSVSKTLKNETLTPTTKNWTVVSNFMATHFQSDQKISKQNNETNK